ncbi:MAG: glycosyltransferase [Pseudomonadota bacterium]
MFALQVAVVKSGGGVTTAALHYARMFKQLGVPSACVHRGPDADKLRADGVDVIEAGRAITAPWLPQGGLRDAVLSRAKGEPIVAIVHSDLALATIARLFPSARIVTPCHSDKVKRKKRADLVVTLNADQHARVSAALAPPPPRVALLGNPYVPTQAPSAPPPEGPPRINFVARFIETKDPMALVRAAALMRSKPAFRFMGEGPLLEETRAAAAQAGLNAEFPGWLAAPFAAFHQNDILVLPSRWEGLPYLLLEALDHAVSVIASDIPGNRTALSDGAFGDLYPLADAAALARVLDEALGALDALRAKAMKGRAALAGRYGAEAFWRALTAELEETGSLHA